MPSYPLPTLAAQITPAGISAPSYNDIYLSLQATFQSIYGSDAYLGPDSQDGQLLAVFAQGINDCNQTAIAIYNSFAPSNGQGTGLSNMVKINGIRRLASSNSTAVVTISGIAGTTITNGVVRSVEGDLFNLPPSVTIPFSGTINVTVTAQATGAITAATGDINDIYTPTYGWQSVTNAAAAVPGAPVETDYALRQRQTTSTSLPAVTPLSSLAGNVANVPGVVRSKIYENDTSVTDVNGVPDHSICVVFEGGDINAIAQVVEAKKSPGTGTFGSTTVSVLDPAGLTVLINLDELTNDNIYVSITLQAFAGYTSSVGNMIKQAVSDFINSLDIGTDVYYEWLAGPASLYGTVYNKTFKVTALTSGTTPAPSGTSDITIAFDHAAECTPANVVLTVV